MENSIFRLAYPAYDLFDVFYSIIVLFYYSYMRQIWKHKKSRTDNRRFSAVFHYFYYLHLCKLYTELLRLNY